MSNDRIYNFLAKGASELDDEARSAWEQSCIFQARWQHRREGLASETEPLYAGGEWEGDTFRVLIRSRPEGFEELKDRTPPHVIADWDLAVA
jgi:hypothetical protein